MHFQVFAYDQPEAGQLRQQLRAEHIAYWNSKAGDVVLLAGAMMSDDGENAVPVGSSFLLFAEDEQAVRALLARDPFMVAGVFREMPQIQRIRPAIGSLWQGGA